MNAATQSASAAGPLHWVRREIDRALESADQALQSCRSDAAAADLARIGDGRTHLHQVRGALTVLGLDGVSQFAAALESLLAAIEQRTCPADEARIALAQRALASLRRYLDELAGGQPDQPLRLLACYREVQAARGEERSSPGDLF
ncbi:MAG: Hpt domain-containing protein, partial [Rhodocyclaceae bacterium]